MPSGDKSSSDVWKTLAKQHIAMMTTTHGGSLVSRPMGSHAEEEAHAIYFIASLDSEVTSDIGASPAVNLGYVDDSNGNYLSVSGNARVSQDRAKLKEIWTAWAQAWLPEGPDGADVALITVTPGEATFWDTTSSKIISTVKTLTAAVTGSPPDTGTVDHVKL